MHSVPTRSLSLFFFVYFPNFVQNESEILMMVVVIMMMMMMMMMPMDLWQRLQLNFEKQTAKKSIVVILCELMM